MLAHRAGHLEIADPGSGKHGALHSIPLLGLATVAPCLLILDHHQGPSVRGDKEAGCRLAVDPAECLSAEENVTNRLAEAFYRDHGVGRIERGLDLAASTAGRRVMRSAYCIRREIGECLKEHPRLRGELWLERGGSRYRLEFDCDRCEMSLVDCTKTKL